MDIYTDGSSKSVGSGWGYVAIKEGNIVITSTSGSGEKGDTNQKMELVAAIEACYWAEENTEETESVTIYSDSAYLINCQQQQWYVNWLSNGWKNSKKEPVANRKQWEELIPFFDNPRFTFKKVKGHSGVSYNEIADTLAQNAAEKSSGNDLTNKKKNVIINIEYERDKMKEILLSYKEDKITLEETMKKIKEM